MRNAVSTFDVRNAVGTSVMKVVSSNVSWHVLCRTILPHKLELNSMLQFCQLQGRAGDQHSRVHMYFTPESHADCMNTSAPMQEDINQRHKAYTEPGQK